MSRTLEADLVTIPDVVGVAARTVVALPPSSLDSAVDLMRVYAGGVLINRAFDPEMPGVVGGGTYGSYEGGY